MALNLMGWLGERRSGRETVMVIEQRAPLPADQEKSSGVPPVMGDAVRDVAEPKAMMPVEAPELSAGGGLPGTVAPAPGPPRTVMGGAAGQRPVADRRTTPVRERDEHWTERSLAWVEARAVVSERVRARWDDVGLMETADERRARIEMYR